MESSRYKRLIVLEKKSLYHGHHRDMFGGCDFIDDLHIFAEPHMAIPYMNARSIPGRSKSRKQFDVVFILCTDTYLKFLENYEFIKKQLASAWIVLRDESCRRGCGFIADRFPFHGYCTCQDTPEEIVRCVSHIADGKPSMTPFAEHLLVTDHDRKVLRSRNEHRIEALYGLGGTQLACLRYFIAGESFEQLAKRFDLSRDYVKKIMYKTRNHFGARRFSDLFVLAKEWGFID